MTITSHQVNKILQDPKTKGVVILSTGEGRAPRSDHLLKGLEVSRSSWAEGKGGLGAHGGKGRSHAWRKVLARTRAAGVQIGEWRAVAFGPDPACCLFLYMNYLHTVKFTCQCQAIQPWPGSSVVSSVILIHHGCHSVSGQGPCKDS